MKVPYGPGAALLAQLLGRAPVQALVLPRLRRKYPLHPLHSGEAPPDRAALQRHLTHLLFRGWRETALDRCSPRAFARWTRFAGNEHLEKAQAAGRGVILAGSHYAAAQTLKILLPRFGLDTVSVGSSRRGRPRGSWRHARVLWLDGRDDEARMAGCLVELRKVLRRGGVVHMAADSSIGRSGVEIDFFGRRPRFAHGLAVLAATTEAPVLPVFAAIRRDGTIAVEFQEPLCPPRRDLPRAERLEALVRAYAARLERKWREDPALIMPGGPLYFRRPARRSAGRADR